MANSVMIDLETLGTRPGSAILSIGAVEFDLADYTLAREFYIEIDRHDSERAGFLVQEDTLAWWTKQSPEAQRVLNPDAPSSVVEALAGFTEFMVPNKGQTVWGNGSDFDLVLLRSAYEKIGAEAPWKYWDNRCYRTMKGVHSKVPRLKRSGTHHNSLDDAKYQALHLLEIYRSLRGD